MASNFIFNVELKIKNFFIFADYHQFTAFFSSFFDKYCYICIKEIENEAICEVQIGLPLQTLMF